MVSAQVVIDLANSPSFEDRAVPEFFETSGRNLLAAETAAGVRHHVALSIVAIDRTDNRYFRAKLAQEKLIEASSIPYHHPRDAIHGIPARASPTHARMETSSGFRPCGSSPSRRTTLLLLSPSWRSPRRATALSKSPAPNERRSTKSSLVYLKALGDPRQVLRDPDARYWGGQVGRALTRPAGRSASRPC